MTNFTPSWGSDDIEICSFSKHQGKRWEDIIWEDPDYVEWLISGEGPKLSDELYDYLTELLEEL